ncbi:MAG: hypothetical protein AB8B91_15065 [Rubripirellula sp.]
MIDSERLAFERGKPVEIFFQNRIFFLRSGQISQAFDVTVAEKHASSVAVDAT